MNVPKKSLGLRRSGQARSAEGWRTLCNRQPGRAARILRLRVTDIVGFGEEDQRCRLPTCHPLWGHVLVHPQPFPVIVLGGSSTRQSKRCSSSAFRRCCQNDNNTLVICGRTIGA